MASADLTMRVQDFIADEVLAIDDEFDGDVEAAGGEGLRIRLRGLARDRGLVTPNGPVGYGGLGLGMVDRIDVLEAAGYSLFGPTAINVNAPDEGNIHLLDHVASPGQRERYLEPLAQGRYRSAFAMTEPSPRAGADPSMLRTAARRVDGGWLIDGEKRFITGADGASFFIIMARTSGEPGSGGGATMFLALGVSPGSEVVRHVETVDKSMLGAHCELRFTELFVSDLMDLRPGAQRVDDPGRRHRRGRRRDASAQPQRRRRADRNDPKWRHRVSGLTPPVMTRGR